MRLGIIMTLFAHATALGDRPEAKLCIIARTGSHWFNFQPSGATYPLATVLVHSGVFKRVLKRSCERFLQIMEFSSGP